MQPLSSTLLENVEQFKIVVLNPQELSQWPENLSDPNDIAALKTLPLAIKIQLTVAGTDYEWIYSLLKSTQPTTTQNSAESS